MNAMKKFLRLTWRLIVALLIVAVVAVASTKGNLGIVNLGAPGQGNQPKDFPSLTALKPIPAGGFYIHPESGRIGVALQVNVTAGGNPDDLARDIVAVYRWGRDHYGPVKCGPDYPPNLCRYGEIGIILLVTVPSESFGPEGKISRESYAAIIEMGCDQIQIDKMLADPPADLDALDQFQAQAAQASLGTGCYAQTYDPPVPFNGFE